MRNEPENQREYLQNLVNKLDLVVGKIAQVSTDFGMELQMLPILNDLITISHVVNQGILEQKYEQNRDFYYVGDDLVDLNTESALQNFLRKEEQ